MIDKLKMCIEMLQTCVEELEYKEWYEKELKRWKTKNPKMTYGYYEEWESPLYHKPKPNMAIVKEGVKQVARILFRLGR